MTDLSAIPTADLYAEINRRLRSEAEAARPLRVLFFGVRVGDTSGHFVREVHTDGRVGGMLALRAMELDARFPAPLRERHGSLYPWRYWERPDSQREQVEGVVVHELHDGWTLVSWWDRSADHRGGCCATFLVEGAHTSAEAVALARERYPALFARFTYEVRP